MQKALRTLKNRDALDLPKSTRVLDGLSAAALPVEGAARPCSASCFELS